MKITAAILLLVVFVAAARPFRFPHRIFYTSPESVVNLTPLFAWWETNANIVSLTKTNRFMTETQLAALLPPRPLNRWMRITAVNFATRGDGWVMQALVEDYPGHGTNRVIFLKHPPAEDRIKFLWVQANIAQINQSVVDAREQVRTDAADANASDRRASNIQDVRDGSEFLDNQLAAKGSDLNQTANEDFRYYQQSARTAASLESQQRAMLKFAGEFDTGRIYQLDFFALDTGFTNGVLPVYDLGGLQK